MEDISVLIKKEDINNKVKEMAGKINNDYKDEELTVICILKGASLFTADLIRELKMPTYLEFMIISSYEIPFLIF